MIVDPNTLVMKTKVHFVRRQRGHKCLKQGAAAPKAEASGRLPRITRLLALAIRFDQLLRGRQGP